MRPRSIALAASVAALAAHSLGLASPARAATPVDVPFAYTGAEQSWVVPAGVTTIHVDLIAGKGGSEPFGPVAGGKGAHVVGDLAVTPGSTLYIEVGGNGQDGDASSTSNVVASFNGGAVAGAKYSGSGGGASDLRTVTRLGGGSLDSRLMAAAGGGGAAPGSSAGGDAGFPGADSIDNAKGGQAGSTNAGGAGGLPAQGGGAGAAGQLGVGGAGGLAGTFGFGGGGGGGGYYGGGGGGGGGDSLTANAAGGGGGSSYTGAASNTSVTLDSSGTPSITISYMTGPAPTQTPEPTPTSAPDNGTVNVQFSVPTSAACIELSTTSIDFGSVRLGSENVAATPDVTVTNCSGISEDILARGSDATATGTTWSLVGGSATCADTLGLDSYRMALESTGGTVGLSTSNAPLGSLAGGDTSTQTARMWAACPGSSGSGQLMTSQITFLATEGS